MIVIPLIDRLKGLQLFPYLITLNFSQFIKIYRLIYWSIYMFSFKIIFWLMHIEQYPAIPSHTAATTHIHKPEAIL